MPADPHAEPERAELHLGVGGPMVSEDLLHHGALLAGQVGGDQHAEPVRGGGVPVRRDGGTPRSAVAERSAGPDARAESGRGGAAGARPQLGTGDATQPPALHQHRRVAEVDRQDPGQRRHRASPGEQGVGLRDQLPPGRLGPAPVQGETGEAGEPGQSLLRRGRGVDQQGALDGAVAELSQQPVERGQEALQEIGVRRRRATRPGEDAAADDARGARRAARGPGG